MGIKKNKSQDSELRDQFIPQNILPTKRPNGKQEAVFSPHRVPLLVALQSRQMQRWWYAEKNHLECIKTRRLQLTKPCTELNENQLENEEGTQWEPIRWNRTRLRIDFVRKSDLMNSANKLDLVSVEEFCLLTVRWHGEAFNKTRCSHC